MNLEERLLVKFILCFISIPLNYVIGYSPADNTYATTQISSSECYDNYGQPRVSSANCWFLGGEGKSL